VSLRNLGIKKWECEEFRIITFLLFIKEFKVKPSKGANHLIRILEDIFKLTFLPYDNFKNMDITPHPDLGHTPADVYQSDWDKFGLWDLVMKNDEELSAAIFYANHPAEA